MKLKSILFPLALVWSFTLNAGAASLSQSAPTITRQTRTSVTVESNPAGGQTPYSYAWHSSYTPNFTANSGTLIAGQTNSATTISITVGRQFVRCAVTDAASNSVTSYQRTIGAAKGDEIALARIGDSTSDLPTGATCHDYAVRQLAAQGGFMAVQKINKSVGGASTTEWLPGTGAMNAFDVSIASATNRVVVSLGLGVNDAQFHRAAGLFMAQLSTIIAHVLALTNAIGEHPIAVFVDYPTWREPGYFNASATFDEVYSTYIFDYCAAIDSLINNTTICAGNKKCLDLFAQYPTVYLSDTDGGVGQVGRIHPSASGAEAMGFEIANAILARLYPPAGGSIIPLAWLQQYNLPTDGSADFVDTDHDGLNNWQEWRAGTTPTNAGSVLQMLVPTDGTNGLAINWQSVSNRTYFLERSTNLDSQPAFSTLASNLVGHVGMTSYTDSNATGPGPFFYRVGVQ